MSKRYGTELNEKLESEDERAFAAELREGVAIKIYKTHWPDRLVLLTGGMHLFIEFKREGEKPRPGQLAVHNWLRDNGHPCFVAHSKMEANNYVQYMRAIGDLKCFLNPATS